MTPPPTADGFRSTPVPGPAVAASSAGGAGLASALVPPAAVVLVVVWVAWTAAFNQAPFGDDIEQFNWSHGLQWGYAKHPPLPTWLMAAAVALVGRVPAAVYAMSAAAVAATGLFTWAIAHRLLGHRAAAAALLLWGLQFSFSWRAQLYNHNTALALCIAATVWCCLKALDGRFGWWIATGLAAGAALLSKYQALLPLAGLLLALTWTSRLKRRRDAAGVAVAVLVMAAVVAPHLVWLTGSDFTTLRYAARSVGDAAPNHAWRSLLSFAANQLRMLSPMLLAAIVCALLARRARRRDGGTASAPTPADAGPLPERDVRRWLVALLWAPVAMLAAIGLAGVGLHNHWGVQAFQFVGLWIAWRWQRRGAIDLWRLAVVAGVLHALLLAGYAVQQRGVKTFDGGRRHDTLYPAHGLARAAQGEWRAVTGCPLKYLSGDVYLAGLAALYGGEGAAVWEGAGSPWIDATDLMRAGQVAMVENARDLPPGTVRVRPFVVGTRRAPTNGRPLWIAVVPPMAPCR